MAADVPNSGKASAGDARNARDDCDILDLRILDLLQREGLATADRLAEMLPLSPSAIARRVRRLRTSGIIVGDSAQVSESIGPFLTALVQVQLDRHALDAVDALLRRIAASPNVQLSLEVTGTFDLILLLTARDMDAFNTLADSLLGADPVVRRYETSFVKRRRKFSTALPIAELLAD